MPWEEMFGWFWNEWRKDESREEKLVWGGREVRPMAK